jgi:hypothetical protein
MVSSLTAFIAFIVAVIAFLQWATARQKVVLDLFDKRFAVYDELRNAIDRNLTQPSGNFEEIAKFAGAAARAQFLFGPDVTDFLESRRKDLASDIYEFRHRPGTVPEERRQEREDQVVARTDRLSSFSRDFDVLVAPYMKHTQKRFPIPFIDP